MQFADDMLPIHRISNLIEAVLVGGASRLVWFFALALLTLDVLALTPSQVFEKVKDSVVIVKAFDTYGKAIVQGSGVVLPSGKIGTNCHVVKIGASFQVGRGKLFVMATVWGSDEDKDICLLSATGLKGKPAQLGQAKRLKVGEPVYAVGAPKGLELSLSDGIVSQLRGAPPPLIQTTAAISPGSSGGGLFNAEGKLVGFTTLYVEGGQSLNFAMPVEWAGEIQQGRKAIEGRSSLEWSKRTSAYEDAENWTALRDWSQKWTQVQPENDTAWFALGNACLHLQRNTEAVEAYREAISINPIDASSWGNLGVAYSNLLGHTEAINAYRKALSLNPEDARSWANLGTQYSELQRYTDAIDVYRKALSINPKNSELWRTLGSQYYALKRYTEANDPLQQAVRANPENSKAWGLLGANYIALGRVKDAIDPLRQFIRLNPGGADSWSLRQLAIGYSILGDEAAALDSLSQLRRIDPVEAEKVSKVIGATP